jgi:hypothetical protein
MGDCHAAGTFLLVLEPRGNGGHTLLRFANLI